MCFYPFPVLAQYLGDLYLVQQAVNLLGKVLDTPDSITAAPDHIGSLYKSVSTLGGCFLALLPGAAFADLTVLVACFARVAEVAAWVLWLAGTTSGAMHRLLCLAHESIT